MQRVRNGLFYFSPLLGALIGWGVAAEFHLAVVMVAVLIGLLVGCAVSGLMIMLSIRARFKSDITLTRDALPKRDRPQAPKSS